MPVSLPLRSGMQSVTALAAGGSGDDVLVGVAAAAPVLLGGAVLRGLGRRRSVDGGHEASSRPNSSLMTLAIGARQLVVPRWR